MAKQQMTLSGFKELLNEYNTDWIVCNILDSFNEWLITDDKIFLHCSKKETVTTNSIYLEISNIESIYIDTWQNGKPYIVHIFTNNVAYTFVLLYSVKA